MLTIAAYVTLSDAVRRGQLSRPEGQLVTLAEAPQGAPSPDGGVVRTEQLMLVLTRKNNESIMIGDEIEVRVLSISKEKIRIGITAPKQVPVFRKEVYLSIQAEKDGDDGDGSGVNVTEEVAKALDGLE